MTVRIGVIGCGAVTYHCHLPALARVADARVVALADHDPVALERARARAPSASLLTVDALMQDGQVDAVLIATPTDAHAEMATRVARAGKHLYLEKPIATSAAQAADLRAIVAHHGVHAAVGFNRRQHPIYRRARACLRDGLIGHVHAVHSVFAEPVATAAMPIWKQTRATGGGVLLDLASHHIDLVRWLLDQEVDMVTARAESRESEHDVATMTLAMRDGTPVQGYYAFRSALADTIELHGECGVLRMDRHRHTITHATHRRFGYGTREARVPLGISWRERWRRLARPSEDPSYEAAWRAFVSLITGRPTEIASMDDGLASLHVVLAAEASALAGSPMRMTPR
ncbi:MAG: Gfo/Idh/MocA family oxidoreductase [Gemmatimonadaceae bacterium]|nr:Gfo/Idh/MocA family oxidoreductase [Gemmatimonadaceae bacterium]